MNPQYETINLSEHLLSENEKKKEKESFYDFLDKTSYGNSQKLVFPACNDQYHVSRVFMIYFYEVYERGI